MEIFNYEKAWQDLRSQTTAAICEMSRLDGQTRGMLPIRGDTDFDRLFNLVNDYAWLLGELKKYQDFDYEVQLTPDGSVKLDNGLSAVPLKTLKNSEGGIAHIIKKGNCFVLIQNSKLASGDYTEYFFEVSEWFPQAALALRSIIF
jgi:hypothetical protein